MKLIILDRDGVINEDSDDFIKSPDEWLPLPGSLEAIARLTHADYRVVVATNQSGIARGLFDSAMLMSIHDKMHHLVAEHGGKIEAVFFCPHGPEDDCDCRKPKPGMFADIGKRLSVDLEGVPTVGDSLRDLQAGQAAGATPYLVKTGKGLRTLNKPEALAGIEVFDDLAAVVDMLLASTD